LTFLADPSPGWANPEDCVEFPCTGPINVVIRIERASYRDTKRRLGAIVEKEKGRQLAALPRTFAIVASNDMSTSAQVIPDCSYQKSWDAYLCTDDNIGVLLFDSLDGDRMDRSVQPVYI